jgi:thiol-disulfide isomerase/thioredoxin
MHLLSFSAPWCKVCPRQKPIVDQFAKKHPEIKVEYRDVQDPNNAALASQWQIMTLPTLAFTDDSGNPIACQPGLHDSSRLEKLFEQARNW